MSVLWFDIFNALGVDHATLMDLKKQYPASPRCVCTMCGLKGQSRSLRGKLLPVS